MLLHGWCLSHVSQLIGIFGVGKPESKMVADPACGIAITGCSVLPELGLLWALPDYHCTASILHVLYAYIQLHATTT